MKLPSGWDGEVQRYAILRSYAPGLSNPANKSRSSPSREEEFTLSDLVSSFEKSHMLLALRWTIWQAWSKLSETLHLKDFIHYAQDTLIAMNHLRKSRDG